MRIGVFDSGVGGLSVLWALHAQLPAAELIYVADSAHAPYGERGDAWIRDRAMCLTRHLIDQGAQAVVVACNTATAVAIGELRHHFGTLPITGVEPGLKPALSVTRNGRIGVMATEATLRSAKFQSLLAAHAGAAHVHLQACHGLAAAIESGGLGNAQLRELVERHCAPLRAAAVDTVALGCTHYVFARELIQQALGPQVQIVDTADAVARQAARACAGFETDLGEPTNRGAVHLGSTGDALALRDFAERWLDFPFSHSAGPPPA
jgi:glutamate racemase